MTRFAVQIEPQYGFTFDDADSVVRHARSAPRFAAPSSSPAYQSQASSAVSTSSGTFPNGVPDTMSREI